MGSYDHLISFLPKPDRPNEDVNWEHKRKIAWIEESVMPGSPYFEIMWFCAPRDPGPPTHTHDFDEVFGFIGGDPENPSELNGVVKFKIGAEWYTFTKSVVFYVPAGLEHAPMIIESVDKPLIHFSGGASVGKVIQKLVENL